MTNGEMIQKVFKGCEVCEPIIEDDIIHVVFADKKDSAIGFDWSWWNAEYKEPATLNDCETCIHNKGVLECDMYGCKYEPTTKNDLGVDCISREQALKELKESAEHHANDSREEVLLRRDRDIIRAMPSVTPQEPILDKIRAEIEEKADGSVGEIADGLYDALEIIDKYKAETEEE